MTSFSAQKITKGPCPCGVSSDAYAVGYSNGPYCFSCHKKFFNDVRGEEAMPENSEAYTIQQVPYRGHSLATIKKYDVKLKVSDLTGEILEAIYPGPKGSEKFRIMESKKFNWKNYKGPGLMGKDKFSAGSSLAVTITEGEEDMMAAYEMLGSKYPVVSVQSSGQAQKDCAADREFLDSFEKIYLCFDNDDQGKKAEAEVSALFPYSKIYIVNKTRFKDANDYLLAGAKEEYNKLWWNAKRHDPENIVSSFADLEEEFLKPKKKAIAEFPFKGLQAATLGIRTGETYLFKALEGIGKTEIMGAIEYHCLKTTTIPIGLIHLEEDLQRTAFRFVNYEIDQPVHLEGVTGYSQEELFHIYKSIVKTDDRLHYYKKGKNDTDTNAFLNAVRFMVASAGCKIVCFDHITRLATSFRLQDERKELDFISTKLSELAEELDFALLMISHINQDGDTRGSKNISKEAWTVINLYRNKLSDDPIERNTTSLEIEKNRHASITGPVGAVYFDPVTFKISDDIPKNLPPLNE